MGRMWGFRGKALGLESRTGFAVPCDGQKRKGERARETKKERKTETSKGIRGWRAFYRGVFASGHWGAGHMEVCLNH